MLALGDSQDFSNCIPDSDFTTIPRVTVAVYTTYWFNDANQFIPELD